MFANRYKLVLLLLSVVTTGFFLWLTRQFGAGSTPDSAAYLSTAVHLLQGRGLIMYDGSPLILWPPFYPALLAALSFLSGSTPYAVSSVLNSILYGCTIYLSGILFFKHLKSPWLALVGTVAVMISVALFWDAFFALTDALYCFLTLVYLVSFEEYARSSRLIWILLAAVAVTLSCLMRYAAMIMIPIGVASILLFYQGTLRSKLKSIAVFFSVSTLPYLAWLVRTYIVAGSPFGSRGPAEYTLPQALNTLFNTLFAWYAPRELLTIPVLALGFGIIVGLSIGLARDNWGKIASVWAGEGDLVLYVVVYLVFLVISGTTSYVSPLDDRLLSPVFAPITLLLLVGIEKIYHAAARRVSPRIVAVALGVVLVASLFYSWQASYALIHMYLNQGGLGFNNVYWRNHNTLGYVVQHPEVVSDCTIYSNEADALFLVAGIESKGMSDRAFLKQIQDQAAQGKFPRENKMCIVWLKGIDRSYLINADDLKAVTTQELRGQFKDGTITAVSKKVN